MNPILLKLNSTLEKRKFSNAFWQFVRDQNDIRGLLAYGLYKFNKISEIKQKNIRDRTDDRLDCFNPNPHMVKTFSEQADQFFDKINSNISTEAIASAQSNQLNRIENSVADWKFWPNVGSSCTASVILSIIVILLPIGLWLSWPDFRRSLEHHALMTLAASIDKPVETINALADQLDEKQRRQFVQAIISEAVHDTISPDYVLDAVIDSFDHRQTKDGMILRHILKVMKRAEKPKDIVFEIYGKEVGFPEPAAPPIAPDLERLPGKTDPFPEISEETVSPSHRPKFKPAIR